MGESVRKCIDRWESAVKKSDASYIKPEIEQYLKRIGDDEQYRSNAARKIYSVLVKNVTKENVANLVEILKYLTRQSPTHVFSYFLVVLFNKTLELDKAVSIYLFF